MIEALGMTNATRGADRRRAAEWFRAILSGRLPFVITFGCLLVLNWGAAFWMIHYSYKEREASAFQLVNDETRYAEHKIANLFKEADRTLLELRARYPGDELRPELDHWAQAGNSGDI